MNDFGNLAYKIVKYEFKDDVTRFPISYVSGWLETNLGELNGLLHEDFTIDASGNIAPYSLTNIEESIFSYLYQTNYYDKAARESLRGIVWGNAAGTVDDWTSIKEGDSSIQRQSKNAISRTYVEISRETRKRMNDLIYQYNSTKSAPLQVAGTDGAYQEIYNNGESR